MAALVLVALALSGCSLAESTPVAALHSMQAMRIVQGAQFRHVIGRNFVADATPLPQLHIYIEGDGEPYKNHLPTKDPTSRTQLMLRLASLDPAPSVYVGRPCYLGLNADPGCNDHYWTDARFAPEVVASLCSAISSERQSTAAQELVLIGHSGGGALAVLLARRCPNVTAVITIAGNLNTTAWTKLHHYAPLTASLDPATGGALGAGILTLHLVGAKDQVTPPDFVVAAAKTIGGTVRIVPGFDHACCWWTIWPDALK